MEMVTPSNNNCTYYFIFNAVIILIFPDGQCVFLLFLKTAKWKPDEYYKDTLKSTLLLWQ